MQYVMVFIVVSLVYTKIITMMRLYGRINPHPYSEPVGDSIMTIFIEGILVYTWYLLVVANIEFVVHLTAMENLRL